MMMQMMMQMTGESQAQFLVGNKDNSKSGLFCLTDRFFNRKNNDKNIQNDEYDVYDDANDVHYDDVHVNAFWAGRYFELIS